MKKVKLPKETIDRIQELAKAGWTTRAIAFEVGVKPPTVSRYAKGLITKKKPKSITFVQR
jgi:IS30 family transposase